LKLGEMFVELGVKADLVTVKDFAASIMSLPLEVAGAIAALGGMSFGAMDLTRHILDVSNNLSIFRSETGLAVDDLQRWQAVSKEVGISTDVVQQSILKLSDTIGNIQLGKVNTEFMQGLGMLGVQFSNQDAYSMFRSIAASASKMQPQRAGAILRMMGLSEELLRLFSLPDLQSRLGGAPIMNQSQIRSMENFQKALGDFTQQLEISFAEPLAKITPYLDPLAKSLTSLVEILGQYGGKVAPVVGAGIAGIKEDGIFPMNTFFKYLDKFMDDFMAKMGIKTFGAPVSINVTTTGDAQSTAETIRHELDRHFTRASKQINNQAKRG